MPWCKVNISYRPTRYTQNYKRQLNVHSHALSQQFMRDALADALRRISAHLPNDHVPNPITQNLLTIQDQADQLDTDPGDNYKLI